jgi:hypothetical protein
MLGGPDYAPDYRMPIVDTTVGELRRLALPIMLRVSLEPDGRSNARRVPALAMTGWYYVVARAGARGLEGSGAPLQLEAI